MTLQFLILTAFFTMMISFTSCDGQLKTKTIADTQPRKSRDLIQDKAGNFWLCNGGNEGVTVYNGKKFTHYTEKDGLSSNFVWTILEDNSGKLWFGTADGITCYDPSAELRTGSKKFTVIPITTITGNTSYHKTTPDPYFGFPKPEENWVESIMQDRSGIFWFGTMSGVYRYDGKTFTHFSHNDYVVNNTGVTIGNIESILEDKNGNIWFGGRTTVGVFRYDGKTLTNFKPNEENWVSPILEDKTGTIWFSSRTAGLYRYNGENFIFFGKGEFSDFFFSMEEDNTGNFWFSNGKKGGVTFYDGKNFINYTAKDGLGENFARCILKDKDGNIWLSGKDNKLCLYDGKIFSTFSE